MPEAGGCRKRLTGGGTVCRDASWCAPTDAFYCPTQDDALAVTTSPGYRMSMLSSFTLSRSRSLSVPMERGYGGSVRNHCSCAFPVPYGRRLSCAGAVPALLLQYPVRRDHHA